MTQTQKMRHYADPSKGILGRPDSKDLWSEIIDAIPEALLLKPDVRILNVASGYCTEALLLAKRMIALRTLEKELELERELDKNNDDDKLILRRIGVQVNNAITLLDKYSTFTEEAKNRYKFKNVIKGDFMEFKTNMKFDIVIGNPPYSDGSHGAVPIYLDFVKKAISLSNSVVALITPNTWTGTGFVAHKKDIVKNGLVSIKHLPGTVFPEVKMNLSYFFMIKGATGDIEVTYSSGDKVNTPRNNPNLFDFKSDAVATFIKLNKTSEGFKLKRSKTRKASYYNVGNAETILTTITAKGEPKYQGITVKQEDDAATIDTTDKNMWKIAFGEYRRGAIALVPPGTIVPNTFYYLPYATEAEAQVIFDYFMTPEIRWIVKNTHTTRTFCGATVKFVPFKTPVSTSLVVTPEIAEAVKSIGNMVPY